MTKAFAARRVGSFVVGFLVGGGFAMVTGAILLHGTVFSCAGSWIGGFLVGISVIMIIGPRRWYAKVSQVFGKRSEEAAGSSDEAAVRSDMN